MNNLSKTILIISIAIISVSALGISVAQADTGLETQFQNDPLFTETNFLPGDSSDGWIKVKNNGEELRTISIWTDNVIDPDNLGDVLNLEIKEGASALYNNTLSDLFSQSKVELSDLAIGAQTQYDLTITFALLAGNEYQGKELQFDLLIGDPSEEEGEEGEDEEDGDTTVTTLGVGTGGGVVPITLKIFNVKTTDIAEEQTTITWQTTLFATSQVIYSSEHESHNFNPDNPDYYGYAHIYPVPEDSETKTFHTIILPGLEPCLDYYYRVVSHRISPYALSISPEYEFTTLCVIGGDEKEEEEEKEEEVGEKVEKEIEEEIEEKIEEKIFITPVEAASEEPKEPKEPEEKPIWQEIVKEQPPDLFLASFLNAIGIPSCLPWWLILLFAIYPLIKAIIAFQKKEKQQSVIWLVGCLIPVILAIYLFLIKEFCIPFWILIVLALATLLAYLLVPTSNKDESSSATNQQI